MHRIDIKPLSVNEAWQGKKFKTPKYKQFRDSVFWLLPNIKIPEPPYCVYYEFGISSKLSDWDNGVKTFQDCLQDRYEFNDNLIYEAHVKKVVVPKGEEYIKFRIDTIKNGGDD